MPHDPMALLETGQHPADSPAPGELTQVTAVQLLDAATHGDTTRTGRAVRAIIAMHYVLLGPDTAYPGCDFCGGGGTGPGGQHCHCQCDCCVCGDPLCLGPCETLSVLLDEIVCAGVPAAAIDVRRTLARLHAEAAGRIAAKELDGLTAEPYGDASPDTEHPGMIKMRFRTRFAAARAIEALTRSGYSLPDVARIDTCDVPHLRYVVRINPPA
jgi:hypothetical protein